MSATGATVLLLDSMTLQGVPGSAVGPGCGGYGFDGESGLGRAGSTFTDVLGTARTFVAPTPVNAGTTQNITVRGEPGDRVGLILGTSAATATYIPQWHGMLLVPWRSAPMAQRLLLLGTVPASGVINYSLPIPALPSGTPSRTVFLQALFTNVQGQSYLSGTRTMTVLP